MDPTYAMMQNAQSIATAAVAGSIAQQNQMLSEQQKKLEKEQEANKIIFKIVIGSKVSFDFVMQARNLEMFMIDSTLHIHDSYTNKRLIIEYTSIDYARKQQELIYAGATYVPDLRYVRGLRFCGQDYTDLIEGYHAELAYQQECNKLEKICIREEVSKYSEAELETRRKQMIRDARNANLVWFVMGIIICVILFCLGIALTATVGIWLIVLPIFSAIGAILCSVGCVCPIFQRDIKDIDTTISNMKREVVSKAKYRPKDAVEEQKLDKKYSARHVYLNWKGTK